MVILVGDVGAARGRLGKFSSNRGGEIVVEAQATISKLSLECRPSFGADSWIWHRASLAVLAPARGKWDSRVRLDLIQRDAAIRRRAAVAVDVPGTRPALVVNDRIPQLGALRAVRFILVFVPRLCRHEHAVGIAVAGTFDHHTVETHTIWTKTEIGKYARLWLGCRVEEEQSVVVVGEVGADCGGLWVALSLSLLYCVTRHHLPLSSFTH